MSHHLLLAFAFALLPMLPGAAQDGPDKTSIEEKTKVHRLGSDKRSTFDAFVYINRIPDGPEQGETSSDVAGRIFGRLANQEGRILLKLPPGMNGQAYNGFKTFIRYEGNGSIGNCAACHALPEFTDSKSYVVTKGGSPKTTPSLRNLTNNKVDFRKALMVKIAAAKQKQNGQANEIDKAYAKMNIGKDDVAGLVAFLNLLTDVDDKRFRDLILDAKLLDTSADIQ